MNERWWHNSVVYQIYPRSFKDSNADGIGDLRGIIEKLDYLKKLGIDVIWLSPVYESPMDDNGYDISDYYAIADVFGDMEDMDDLILQAKERGIRIVMDLVVNHTSDEHAWFIESKKSVDNSKRNWYIWKAPGPNGEAPNNWGSWFSRSAWTYDETTKAYYLHLFSPKQPDLNWENPDVRDAIFEMMTYWLEKGIGGFRMDVINLIGKPQDYPDGALTGIGVMGIDQFANHASAHTFLREMNRRVLSKYDLLTVGETPNVTPYEGKLYSHPDRHELGMVFQFEHMDVDRDDLFSPQKPLDLPKLKHIMKKWQEELHGQGWNSLYWSNHDQARTVSRFGNDTTPEYRILSAKMLATTLHFMEGTPYIYQGEEIGMTNRIEKSIDAYDDLFDHHRYDVLVNDRGLTDSDAMAIITPFSRDNARTPMQWDDSENAGFTTGKPWLSLNPNYLEINVDAALSDKNSIFYHYQKLIQLRKDSPYSDAIIYGRHEMILESDPVVFAYKRMTLNQTLLVVSNFSDQDVERALDETAIQVVISNYEDTSLNLVRLTLRPYESAVFEIV